MNFRDPFAAGMLGLMEVRSATAQDVPAVLLMVRKIAAMHERLDPAKFAFRADPAELYRDWLTARASDSRAVFLVADVGAASGPVGFLIATIEREIPIYRVRETGFIHDLWVEEDYRHEGLGRALVITAVERFRSLGMKQIRCDTAWANEPARSLFRLAGFRPATVEMLIEL